MFFYAFYVVALLVVLLHYTGWLARHRLEWLVYVIAVSVMPVVLFLR